MEPNEIITYLILPALGGLYFQQYRLHGCLRRLEGKYDATHKSN